MYSPELVTALNQIASILFFGLLFIGAGSTVFRAIYYRAHEEERPDLLTRDALFLGGFGGVVGAIFIARVFGLGVVLAGNVLWALVTDVVSVVAIGVYVYYELFVIKLP